MARLKVVFDRVGCQISEIRDWQLFDEPGRYLRHRRRHALGHGFDQALTLRDLLRHLYPFRESARLPHTFPGAIRPGSSARGMQL